MRIATICLSVPFGLASAGTLAQGAGDTMEKLRACSLLALARRDCPSHERFEVPVAHFEALGVPGTKFYDRVPRPFAPLPDEVFSRWNCPQRFAVVRVGRQSSAHGSRTVRVPDR